MTPDHAGPQSAFERAVQRERDAIIRHEAAAVRMDEIATFLEKWASRDQDGFMRRHALDEASNARARAHAARARAIRARQRLRDEGVSPDA